MLGAANLAWLVVQARRAAVTHRLALEAHEWARERRDAESEDRRREQEFIRWCEDVRATIARSEAPVLITGNPDPRWVLEGEKRGYFRRTTDPAGTPRLWKPL